jgi:hypothetical protein
MSDIDDEMIRAQPINQKIVTNHWRLLSEVIFRNLVAEHGFFPMPKIEAYVVSSEDLRHAGEESKHPDRTEYEGLERYYIPSRHIEAGRWLVNKERGDSTILVEQSLQPAWHGYDIRLLHELAHTLEVCLGLKAGTVTFPLDLLPFYEKKIERKGQRFLLPPINGSEEAKQTFADFFDQVRKDLMKRVRPEPPKA